MRDRVFLVVFFCCMAGTAAAQHTLSLEDALAGALGGNADILMKQYAVDSARGELKSRQAVTDLTLGGDVSYGKTFTPIDPDDTEYSDETPSYLSGSGHYVYIEGYENNSFSSKLWLQKLFPSGLNAKVSTYLSRTNVNNQIDTNIDIPSYYDYLIDPEARNYAGAAVDLSLPLLKSFSNSLVKGDIDSARTYLEQQEYELSDEIAKTVLGVSDSYWTYVVAYQKYNRLVESNTRLVTAMENLKKLVQAGQRTSIELTRMQANIARSKTGVIVARTNMQTKRSALLQTVGESAENEDISFSMPADTFPDSPAVAETTSLDWLKEDGVLQQILEKRPDVKSLQRQVNGAQLQAKLAGIDCKPDFNAYISFGFDGTQYGDNEFVDAYGGNIIGLNITGGVNFSLPVQKNRYGLVESAEAQSQQAMLILSEKTRTLKNDLDAVSFQVLGSRESLLNAFQVVLLYKELLEADQKRFDAGLITVEDLFNSEEQFVDAESQYDESYRAYFQAVIALKYCTGNLYHLHGDSSLTKDDLLRLP